MNITRKMNMALELLPCNVIAVMIMAGRIMYMRKRQWSFLRNCQL